MTLYAGIIERTGALLGATGGRLRPAAALATGVLAGIGLQLHSPLPASPAGQATGSELRTVEVATVGIDGRTQSPVVLLREPETGQILPIWVGDAEGRAIALALHGIELPRPMTHDLMASLLAGLNVVVEEVVVRDLRNDTYIGLVRLRVAGEDAVVEVDSRPSDAVALALRTGSPIRVAGWILDQAPEVDFLPPHEDDQIVRTMGVTVIASTPAVRSEFNLPDRPGVVISAVAPEGQALGLRRGDLVLEVNGQTPATPFAFFEAVRAGRPGEPVRLLIWRAGEEMPFELPGAGASPAVPARQIAHAGSPPPDRTPAPGGVRLVSVLLPLS